MAKGKQLGEFSLKFTSLTLTPGAAGSIVTQGNCEGTATGFGTVLGTAAFVGGKSGTFSWCSTAHLDNGDQLSGIGLAPTRAAENTTGRRTGLFRSPMAAGRSPKVKST